MIQVRRYAVQDAQSPLVPFRFERREPGPFDVRIEILYSGICHSDLHQARNDWSSSRYPMVPGHEIVGRVAEVGAQVEKLKAGDLAAVGCMVDSCRQCSACREDLEQVLRARPDAYLQRHGARQRKTDFRRLFRADRRRRTFRGEGAGQKVGIIGLGGLGHMGIKFAKAMGARVVMITTSPGKGSDAARLGADEVLVSRDKAAMAANATGARRWQVRQSEVWPRHRK